MWNLKLEMQIQNWDLLVTSCIILDEPFLSITNLTHKRELGEFKQNKWTLFVKSKALINQGTSGVK